MPLYDYQCEKCGNCFENEHAMSFTGKVKCPACGSVRTTKVFHAAGVHFKGSGFYVTDSTNSRGAANSNETVKDITPKPTCENCPIASENGKCPTPKSDKKTSAKKH